jgi:hypothetical protein
LLFKDSPSGALWMAKSIWADFSPRGLDAIKVTMKSPTVDYIIR